jgi:integrase
MSKLRKALEEYLAMRQAVGFKLEVQSGLLRGFVEFAEAERASSITSDLALRWATQPKGCDPAQWAKRLGLVRRFAEYRGLSDPRTEVPSPDLLPHRFRRKPPFIYTDSQIEQLIEGAKHLRSPSGMRAATFSTLFGLLAVTGMRVGEAIALDRSDAELAEGILTIRQAKFGKSRLIPLHASTRDTLRHYVRLRDRAFKTPVSPSFFVSCQGHRLSRSSVKSTFVLLLRRIGLRRPIDRRGPRIHDLRHGFAIRTMLRFYSEADDVEQRIPLLATYLGHANVANTYWYLTATPELLQLASGRLDGDRPEVTP